MRPVDFKWKASPVTTLINLVPNYLKQWFSTLSSNAPLSLYVRMSFSPTSLLLLSKTDCLKMYIPNNMHITYTYQIFNHLNYVKQWFSPFCPTYPFQTVRMSSLLSPQNSGFQPFCPTYPFYYICPLLLLSCTPFSICRNVIPPLLRLSRTDCLNMYIPNNMHITYTIKSLITFCFGSRPWCITQLH